MKRTAYYHQRAAEIIKQIRYTTVATADDGGHPWNSPVSAQYDDSLTFYWVSDKNSQHSRNIRKTGVGFIVMYDSTVPEGAGEGVYMSVKVREVTDREEIRAIRHQKKGFDNDDSSLFVDPARRRRMYKAEPQKMWMNDAEIKNGVFIRDYRVELSIGAVRRAIPTLRRR